MDKHFHVASNEKMLEEIFSSFFFWEKLQALINVYTHLLIWTILWSCVSGSSLLAGNMWFSFQRKVIFKDNRTSLEAYVNVFLQIFSDGMEAAHENLIKHKHMRRFPFLEFKVLSWLFIFFEFMLFYLYPSNKKSENYANFHAYLKHF